MTYNLTGKIAIVTGGGSGIGRACALALAAAGASVGVFGRTAAKAEAVAAEIAAAGGSAFGGGCDVSRGEDVRAMVAATAERFGGVDILVASAGISPSGRVTEISEDEWDECVGINMRGVFLGAKYAIPEMLRRGGGAIVNVAGTFGLRGARGKAAYAAAKAGAVNLTRAVALDYAREGIRCNVVCPGYVDTPLNDGFAHTDRDAFLEQSQPLRGLCTAEDVAGMVLYLASDAARMVTGQVFVIDGGQQAGLF